MEHWKPKRLAGKIPGSRGDEYEGAVFWDVALCNFKVLTHGLISLGVGYTDLLSQGWLRYIAVVDTLTKFNLK
jgi:hypothetical protein